MNIDERITRELGSLVLQLHQKAAQIDDMASSIDLLQKTIAELKEQLHALQPHVE